MTVFLINSVLVIAVTLILSCSTYYAVLSFVSSIRLRVLKKQRMLLSFAFPGFSTVPEKQ